MPIQIWETCMFFPGLSRAECASWVQAWGSIAAIVVAIWIGRRTRLDEERSVADLEQFFEGRADMAMWRVRRCADDVDVYGLRLALAELQSLMTWAPRVRIELLGTRAADSFANYQSSVSVVIAAVELALSFPQLGPPDFSLLCEEVDAIICSLQGAEKHASGVLKQHESWATWVDRQRG